MGVFKGRAVPTILHLVGLENGNGAGNRVRRFFGLKEENRKRPKDLHT